MFRIKEALMQHELCIAPCSVIHEDLLAWVEKKKGQWRQRKKRWHDLALFIILPAFEARGAKNSSCSVSMLCWVES
jgi:hypothetical protein